MRLFAEDAWMRPTLSGGQPPRWAWPAKIIAGTTGKMGVRKRGERQGGWPWGGSVSTLPPAQGQRWGRVTLVHPGSTGSKRPAFPLWPPRHEPAACWALPNPSSLPCPHGAPSPPPPFLPEFPGWAETLLWAPTCRSPGVCPPTGRAEEPGSHLKLPAGTHCTLQAWSLHTHRLIERMTDRKCF